jgi:hypothetical protein
MRFSARSLRSVRPIASSLISRSIFQQPDLNWLERNLRSHVVDSCHKPAPSRSFVSRFLFLLTIVSSGAIATAQVPTLSTTTQTPVGGAGHDYIFSMDEIVSPVNGALSIRIAAPTAQERYHAPYLSVCVRFKRSVQPLPPGRNGCPICLLHTTQWGP